MAVAVSSVVAFLLLAQELAVFVQCSVVGDHHLSQMIAALEAYHLYPWVVGPVVDLAAYHDHLILVAL